MNTLGLLATLLVASAAVLDAAKMRIALYVTPKALKEYTDAGRGGFGSYYQDINGPTTQEMNEVFSKRQGFNWDVEVVFASVGGVTQRQADKYLSLVGGNNPAKSFCSDIQGSEFDIGVLVVSQQEVTNAQPNDEAIHGEAAGSGTACSKRENENCVYLSSSILRGRPSPVYKLLLAHEIGHLMGGRHSNQAACSRPIDIQTYPATGRAYGKYWGRCTGLDMQRYANEGKLQCLGIYNDSTAAVATAKPGNTIFFRFCPDGRTITDPNESC